jgi:hypothetical protein
MGQNLQTGELNKYTNLCIIRQQKVAIVLTLELLMI